MESSSQKTQLCKKCKEKLATIYNQCLDCYVKMREKDRKRLGSGRRKSNSKSYRMEYLASIGQPIKP